MAEPGFYCRGCLAVVPLMFSIDYFLLIDPLAYHIQLVRSEGQKKNPLNPLACHIQLHMLQGKKQNIFLTS